MHSTLSNLAGQAFGRMGSGPGCAPPRVVRDRASAMGKEASLGSLMLRDGWSKKAHAQALIAKRGTKLCEGKLATSARPFQTSPSAFVGAMCPARQAVYLRRSFVFRLEAGTLPSSAAGLLDTMKLGVMQLRGFRVKAAAQIGFVRRSSKVSRLAIVWERP